MGMAFLTNLAFISNLAGPDMILILLVVLLLFGARRLRGLSSRESDRVENKDEEGRDIARTRTIQPPHWVDKLRVIVGPQTSF